MGENRKPELPIRSTQPRTLKSFNVQIPDLAPPRRPRRARSKQRRSRCAIFASPSDWILAMIAAGLGFSFMPENSVCHAGVVARPVTDPEFWREVNLVTVRGRPHSPAVGAFVREAMRTQWLGKPALAVRIASEKGAREADGLDG